MNIPDHRSSIACAPSLGLITRHNFELNSLPCRCSSSSIRDLDPHAEDMSQLLFLLDAVQCKVVRMRGEAIRYLSYQNTA
jgi:hypothetical protein